MGEACPPGADLLFKFLKIAGDFGPLGAKGADNMGFGHPLDLGKPAPRAMEIVW